MSKKRNKLYFVFESYEYIGVIVSAPNAREAKKYNEMDLEYIDIRVKAVKGGSSWYMGEHEKDFEVTGKGFVYTDLPTGVLAWESEFVPELEKQGRIKWEAQDE